MVLFGMLVVTWIFAIATGHIALAVLSVLGLTVSLGVMWVCARY